MFTKTGNNGFTRQPEDILSYSQGVTDSSFYPFLKGKFEEGLGITYESMKDFKKDLMAVYYSKLKVGNFVGPRRQIFAEHYPHIEGLLRLLKRKNHLGKKSYTLPVILLQRIEAHIFLDRICKKIAATKPGVPLFSIHDNIVTTEGNEAFVKQIIEEELAKCIGLVPQIQQEVWE